MDMQKFLTKFVDLLNKAKNLPEVLQCALLPLLVIFTLLIAPVLIVNNLWKDIQIFSKNVVIQKFTEQLLEVKQRHSNRLIGRIEKFEDAVKTRNEIEQLLDAIVKGQKIVSNKNETIDKLQKVKYKLNRVAHGLDLSREDLRKLNAEIYSITQKYLQYSYHSQLTLWLVKNLPEDWCFDLEELRSEWISSGCMGIVLQLQTIRCLLEMGWAKLMIKWQDFCDGSAIKQINNRHRSNLATDIPNLSNLALDPERLERWRYPLAIFVGTYDHDRVSRALTPLVQKHPAFISQIVSSELARAIWDFKKPVSLPPTMECGQRIRDVMQAWIDGIDPLSKLIAPVCSDGILLPVGVHTSETYLTTSWYYGNENKSDIVVLPSSHFTASYEWPTVRRGEPSHKLAWAWDWTFKELIGSLSELLQRRMLPVSNGLIFRETIWQVALIVTRRRKFHNSPIPLNEIKECLSTLPSNIFPSGLKNYEREYYIKLLVDEINRGSQVGEVELHPLYPKPDININGWTCHSYSEQQLLARVKAIYSKAIEGYQQLVNTWFPKFAPRLMTAVTLPACLVGVVTPSQFFNTEVGVQWYFEALRKGQSSYVDLSFGETAILIGNDHLYSQVNEQLLFLRKDAAAWISAKMHSQLLSISNPNSATELAYKWLWDDLNQVAWVDGNLGNAPLS